MFFYLFHRNISFYHYRSTRGRYPLPPPLKGQKSIFQKHDFSTFSQLPHGSFFKMLNKYPPVKDPIFSKGGAGGYLLE